MRLALEGLHKRKGEVLKDMSRLTRIEEAVNSFSTTREEVEQMIKTELPAEFCAKMATGLSRAERILQKMDRLGVDSINGKDIVVHLHPGFRELGWKYKQPGGLATTTEGLRNIMQALLDEIDAEIDVLESMLPDYGGYVQ